MKKTLVISALTAFLALTGIPAGAQNHIQRAMDKARRQQEEMARSQVVISDQGSGKSGFLPFTVGPQGDTTYFDSIDPIWIFAHGKTSDKEWKKYYRLVYNFARVYPYALASGRLKEIVDSTIDAGNYGRMKKDRYMKKVEKQLFADFEGALHSMTISQGALLLKLIDRETGIPPYTIIKEYLNGAAAGFWQAVAKLFDNDLKSEYDPEGADRNMEELVQMWHAGTFDNLYRSIFWENPPEINIPDLYKDPPPVD